LAIIFGSKLESRSRGTLISTGPVSVSTVLARWPFRELPPLRPAGVVLLIAEVIIELAFQGTLDHHLGQLAQQPALAGQLQPRDRARSVSSGSSCSSAADSSTPS
jgi:hypothetical protein